MPKPSLTQSAADRRSAEAELRTLVTKFAPAHERLIAAVRRSLRKRLPSAHEVVYEYRSWFVISYSPSDRGYEGILALRADSASVKLYFTQGKTLPDPDKLLKGSANARWVLLDRASALSRPAVVLLIDEAIGRNRVAFESAGKGTIVIRTTAKKPRQRR